MFTHNKNRRTLTVFFVLMELLTTTGLFIIGDYDYVRMTIADLVFWLGYTLIEIKNKWFLPSYIRMMVILVIISDGLLGDLFNLYMTSPLYDRIQHVVGTYALTLWAFVFIQQITGFTVFTRRLHFIMLVSLGATLGTIYEIIEFLEDSIFQPVIKNQPSLLDTDLDLIADMIGGTTAAVHSLLTNKLHLTSIQKKQSKKY